MRLSAVLLALALCGCLAGVSPAPTPWVAPAPQPWQPPAPTPAPTPPRPGALSYEVARTVQVDEAVADVLARLGPPVDRQGLPGGEEDIAWHARDASGNAALLVVRVGPDGLVDSVVLW